MPDYFKIFMATALIDHSAHAILGDILNELNTDFRKVEDSKEDLEPVQNCIDKHVERISEKSRLLKTMFEYASIQVRFEDDKGFGLAIPVWFMEWLSIEKEIYESH